MICCYLVPDGGKIFGKKYLVNKEKNDVYGVKSTFAGLSLKKCKICDIL